MNRPLSTALVSCLFLVSASLDAVAAISACTLTLAQVSDEAAITPPDDQVTLNELANAVVSIRVYESGEVIPTVSGSGFFIREDLIVTCAHVVEGGVMARAVGVDGREWAVSELAAENLPADLALLRVTGGPPQASMLRLSNSLPQVGTSVRVISNPLGRHAGTLASGQVSAVREKEDRFDRAGDRIQISVPVSPGSSGAPIVDSDNAVIGVVSYKDGAGELVNYGISSLAIPNPDVSISIALVTRAVPDLYGADISSSLAIARSFCKRGYPIASLAVLDSIAADAHVTGVSSVSLQILRSSYWAIELGHQRYVERGHGFFSGSELSADAGVDSAQREAAREGWRIVRRANEALRILTSPVLDGQTWSMNALRTTVDDSDRFRSAVVDHWMKRREETGEGVLGKNPEGVDRPVDLSRLQQLGFGAAADLAEGCFWRLAILSRVTGSSPLGGFDASGLAPLTYAPSLDPELDGTFVADNMQAALARDLWQLGRQAVARALEGGTNSGRLLALQGIYQMTPASFVLSIDDRRARWSSDKSNRRALETLRMLDPSDPEVLSIAWPLLHALEEQRAIALGTNGPNLPYIERVIQHQLDALKASGPDVALIASLLALPLAPAALETVLEQENALNPAVPLVRFGEAMSLLGRARHPWWGSAARLFPPPTKKELTRAKAALTQAIRLAPGDKNLHWAILKNLIMGPVDSVRKNLTPEDARRDLDGFKAWTGAWPEHLELGASIWEEVRRHSPLLAASSVWSGWDSWTSRDEWEDRPPESYSTALSFADRYVRALASRNWVLAYALAGGSEDVSSGEFAQAMDPVRIEVAQLPWISKWAEGEAELELRLKVSGEPTSLLVANFLSRWFDEESRISLRWTSGGWASTGITFSLASAMAAAGTKDFADRHKQDSKMRVASDILELARSTTDSNGDSARIVLQLLQDLDVTMPSTIEEVRTALIGWGAYPMVTDGWGAEFVLDQRRTKKGAPSGGRRLISCGPNGVYEGGNGDDLVVWSER